jgi:rSAM/selenodomain-associated transferase 1
MVKTRLAATMGDKFAAYFYRQCAEHIIQETAQLMPVVDRYLFYDAAGQEMAMRRWLGPDFHYQPQVGAHLGRRLAYAFQVAFAGEADRAVIIGTDIPDLTAGLLRQAFAALETYDTVIGPAVDGGYYLLGLREMIPELFRDIAWSTGRVLAQTKQRLDQQHLTMHLLPPLIDIDTAEDLHHWIAAGQARL